MKFSGYMTRAMAARDRRYATILGKLGYTASVETVSAPDPDEPDIAAVRAEYERLIGKRPFMGWDAATLRAKIAAHEAAE